jgi:hypothetical protein
MNLKNAKIAGFLTKASGMCFHCGAGIKHCVIVIDPATGENVTIGTTCAEQVGVDSYALKHRLTSEAAEAKKEKQRKFEDAQFQKRAEMKARMDAKKAKRKEEVGFIIDHLESLNSEFHNSLAEQLLRGGLSYRQATFVCKAMVGGTGRRTKKNAEIWDNILDLAIKD